LTIVALTFCSKSCPSSLHLDLDSKPYMSWSFLCSMIWGGGDCSFCWPSLFKVSLHIFFNHSPMDMCYFIKTEFHSTISHWSFVTISWSILTLIF
jgi:hypothetical protein